MVELNRALTAALGREEGLGISPSAHGVPASESGCSWNASSLRSCQSKLFYPCGIESSLVSWSQVGEQG